MAYILENGTKTISQLAGFEPTRAEPIGFQVQRLNHSATTAQMSEAGNYLACIVWVSGDWSLAKNTSGDAGDRTPGLSHAKRTLYH